MSDIGPTRKIAWWMRLYGYFVVVAAVYGIAVAHLPVILGHVWSVCVIDGAVSLPCVLTIHLYDAGLTILLLLFGWYSIARATPRRTRRYLSLLVLALAIEVAFFTFEAVELLWNFQNHAASWENYIIASIAVILFGGFILGVYVHQRILSLSIEAESAGSPAGAIRRGSDGFYHPASERQVVALIEMARDLGLQVRARGAAHSVAWSVYSDPGAGDPPVPNKVGIEHPPEGPNVNLMLDRLDDLEWIDEANGIVEVGAGIHLGLDPRDPSGRATLENSLLFQAFLKGWGLADLGGITHQTVAGFLGTGSAGGSLKYDLAENIVAFRLVDGRGVAEWIERGDPAFDAVTLSMGLLGVVTRVRLKLTRTYDIEGGQVTVPASGPDCPIDLFGPGDAARPSLRRFLEDTPYTRLLWWPQRGAQRVVVWEAKRTAASPWPDPGLEPYREFEDDTGGQLEQLGGAVFFTLLGNRGFLTIWRKLGPCFRQFRHNVRRMWRRSMGPVLATILAPPFTALLALAAFLVTLPFIIFPRLLLRLYPWILDRFQPMSEGGRPEGFRDYYWRSLPMDNGADDVLLGTEFTELWVPLSYTEPVMNLLLDQFDAGGFGSTGYYATELYAGHSSESWMSPGHASGEYEDGTLRIDLFWYVNNEGSPNARDGYFAQFWDLLRDHDIPFRLHWGKFIPDYNHADWAAYYRSQLPRWDDFLDLRARRDPDGVFLTSYWRLHLLGEP